MTTSTQIQNPIKISYQGTLAKEAAAQIREDLAAGGILADSPTEHHSTGVRLGDMTVFVDLVTSYATKALVLAALDQLEKAWRRHLESRANRVPSPGASVRQVVITIKLKTPTDVSRKRARPFAAAVRDWSTEAATIFFNKVREGVDDFLSDNMPK